MERLGMTGVGYESISQRCKRSLFRQSCRKFVSNIGNAKNVWDNPTVAEYSQCNDPWQ